LWMKSESVITENDLFSKSFLIFNSFQWCWSFATFLGSDAKMRYYLEVQINRIERERERMLMFLFWPILFLFLIIW
jgi:hypothetical protein